MNRHVWTPDDFFCTAQTLRETDLRQPITEHLDSAGFMQQLGVQPPNATCMFWAGTARQIRESFTSLILRQLNDEILHYMDNKLWTDSQAQAVKRIGIDSFLGPALDTPAAVWAFALVWRNRWIAKLSGGDFEDTNEPDALRYSDFQTNDTLLLRCAPAGRAEIAIVGPSHRPIRRSQDRPDLVWLHPAGAPVDELTFRNIRHSARTWKHGFPLSSRYVEQLGPILSDDLSFRSVDPDVLPSMVPRMYSVCSEGQDYRLEPYKRSPEGSQHEPISQLPITTKRCVDTAGILDAYLLKFQRFTRATGYQNEPMILLEEICITLDRSEGKVISLTAESDVFLQQIVEIRDNPDTHFLGRWLTKYCKKKAR